MNNSALAWRAILGSICCVNGLGKDARGCSGTRVPTTMWEGVRLGFSDPPIEDTADGSVTAKSDFTGYLSTYLGTPLIT